MTVPTIVITRRLAPAVVELFSAHGRVIMWEADGPVSQKWLAGHLAGAEALLCVLTDGIDRTMLQKASRLRVISSLSVGVDHIDVLACTARGIPVGHTPGVLTDTTADLAFGLLMAAARRLDEGSRYVRQGQWVTWDPDGLLGHDVHGATLGIVGFGRIGQAMARRAQGFKMEVLVAKMVRADHTGKECWPRAEKGHVSECHQWTWTDAEPVTALPFSDVLSRADFLSLHVPLTASTYQLIGISELRQMKPSAILINTARGAVVDTDALCRALQEGLIAGAALDVTDPEPLPASHLLLSFPNCLVLPHVGSASVATRARMTTMALQNVVAGLAGKRLPYCANPGIYDR